MSEYKVDLVALVEKIASERDKFEREKHRMSKKIRKQEIRRINSMITDYNSIIPKAMKYL